MYKHAKSLLDYLEQRYIVDNATGCWNWRMAGDKDGYGQAHGIWPDFHKKWRGHQLAHIQWKGLIPEGKVVCHTCDNTKCINPEHLFLGSVLDNNMDCIRKGRNNAPKGEKRHNSKLTEQEVVEILDLKGFVPCTKLGPMYGVNFSLIAQIWRKEIWKHVKEEENGQHNCFKKAEGQTSPAVGSSAVTEAAASFN